MMKLTKIASMLKIIKPEFSNPETDQELEIALAFETLETMIKEGC